MSISLFTKSHYAFVILRQMTPPHSACLLRTAAAHSVASSVQSPSNPHAYIPEQSFASTKARVVSLTALSFFIITST